MQAIATPGQWTFPEGTYLLKTFLSPAAASSAAPAISQVLVYILMAGVLVWRPTGLFGQRT